MQKTSTFLVSAKNLADWKESRELCSYSFGEKKLEDYKILQCTSEVLQKMKALTSYIPYSCALMLKIPFPAVNQKKK